MRSLAHVIKRTANESCSEEGFARLKLDSVERANKGLGIGSCQCYNFLSQ